jgi:hypothetical protein
MSDSLANYKGHLEGILTLDEKTLTIKCNNRVVVVENVTYVPNYTFERDGGIWYMIHNSTLLDKELWIHDSYTTFINLDTGETHKVPYLSFWRGQIEISPNGKFAAIDAGICGSSARKIYIVDLTDWENVTITHYEEIWTFIDYTVSFNDNSDSVFTYTFYFAVLDNHVSLMEEDSITDKDMITAIHAENGYALTKYHRCDVDELYAIGGIKKTITTQVTRRRNPEKITSKPFDEKAAEPKESRWVEPKKYKQFYESCIWLDEMDIIDTTHAVGRPKVRNNIEVTTDNFEQYLNK